MDNLKFIYCKNNFDEYENIPVEKFVFRPSAYGIVYHKGQIIVLTNKSNGKIWFPGGGINVDEKMEDGLKREILEETGLRVKVKKTLLVKENFFYYKPLDEAYHAFLFFYLCKPITTKLVTDDLVNDIESIKPRWVRISDIKRGDISDLSEEIWCVLKDLE